MAISRACPGSGAPFIAGAARATAAVRAKGILIGSAALLYAAAVQGQSLENAPPSEPAASPAAQVLYKGVVGNLLESVPLDGEDRVQLQRLNALLSNPIGARSLAVALGIAQPPLMLVGLVWGIWSAAKIVSGSRNRSTVSAQRNMPDSAEIPSDTAAAIDISAVLSGHDELASVTASAPRYAALNALAGIVGGASPADRALPCDNCVMPILNLNAQFPVVSVR